MLVALMALGGCNGAAAPGDADRLPALTAAAITERQRGDSPASVGDERYAAGDPARGERLFLQCRACHSVEPDGPSIAGPNLYGIAGSPAGEVAGFAYSRALAAADFVWTPRALDAWLHNPAYFLPGNRMFYAGLYRPEDRRDLIAYLLTLR